MGLISIEGMEFFAYHGCFAEERVIGTRFLVDILFKTETEQAEQSDDLADTINYVSVYQVVKKEMEIKAHLLEHVARRILDRCTDQFPGISHAQVRIAKLNPPLGGKTEKVSVMLTTNEVAPDGPLG